MDMHREEPTFLGCLCEVKLSGCQGDQSAVAYVLGQRKVAMLNFLSEVLNPREMMLMWNFFFFFQKSYNNNKKKSSNLPRIRFQAEDHAVSHFHLLSTYCMHLQQKHIQTITFGALSDLRQARFYLPLTGG